MRIFNDRNIATKIAIGFACVLAIMAVISTTAYFAFDKVDGGFRTFARQTSNSGRAATVDQNFLFVRWQAREFGLTGEQSFLDGARKGLTTLAESIQAAETAIVNPERKQKMAEIGKQAATWKTGFREDGCPAAGRRPRSSKKFSIRAASSCASISRNFRRPRPKLATAIC